MAGLNLSYCQLIKIILSQIGGNPLQQVYSQLSQGSPQIIAKSGILPAGLSELKSLIEQVTATINAAQQQVQNFNDTMEQIAGQFFFNPLGTAIDGAITAMDARKTTADARVALIDAYLADPTTNPEPTKRSGFIDLAADRADAAAESAAMAAAKISMQTHKTNTDRLVGLTPQSGSAIAGGCSLQDLLGSACSPNNDVPDVDLKALLESLKRGDAILAIKEKLLSASGYSDIVQSLTTFKSTIDGFNTNYSTLINKAAIRSAVQSQITQIVFNLLTGCGGQVYDLTLKPSVKSTVATYSAAIQAQQEGTAYVIADGNSVPVVNAEVTPIASNITVKLT